MISTIGDGSCLLHAICISLCLNYRKLEDKNKQKCMIFIRNDIYTYIEKKKLEYINTYNIDNKTINDALTNLNNKDYTEDLTNDTLDIISKIFEFCTIIITNTIRMRNGEIQPPTISCRNKELWKFQNCDDKPIIIIFSNNGTIHFEAVCELTNNKPTYIFNNKDIDKYCKTLPQLEYEKKCAHKLTETNMIADTTNFIQLFIQLKLNNNAITKILEPIPKDKDTLHITILDMWINIEAENINEFFDLNTINNDLLTELKKENIIKPTKIDIKNNKFVALNFNKIDSINIFITNFMENKFKNTKEYKDENKIKYKCYFDDKDDNKLLYLINGYYQEDYQPHMSLDRFKDGEDKQSIINSYKIIDDGKLSITDFTIKSSIIINNNKGNPMNTIPTYQNVLKLKLNDNIKNKIKEKGEKISHNSSSIEIYKKTTEMV